MIINHPKEGDTRARETWCTFPKRKDQTTYWLERVVIKEIFSIYYDYSGGWTVISITPIIKKKEEINGSN